MERSGAKIASALFFAAATQLVLGITIAEALFPGYSISGNYISDLGTGPSSLIFNSSIFLLGLLTAGGAYFLRRTVVLRTTSILLLIMALGAMGVGIFNQDYVYLHSPFAFLAFLFSGLSAASSSRIAKAPFAQISAVLGAMTLGALALFSAGILTNGSLTSDITFDSAFYLGLGPGGMERMILYPALLWLAGFSTFLATGNRK